MLLHKAPEMKCLKQFLLEKFLLQRIGMNNLFGNKKIELYSAIFIFIILGLIVIGIIWSSFATLDKIARGSGKVIPSSQVQIIQNLEGGILAELFIEEGDVVNKNDILLRIDDTNFSSTLRENKARRNSLIAQLRRLEAEVTQKEIIDFSGINDSKAIKAEEELFVARKNKYLSSLSVLERQQKQKEQEIKELEGQIKNLKYTLSLANEEKNILKPMVEKGVTSKIELIRTERQVAELKQALDSSILALPRVKSMFEESKKRINEHRAIFISEGRKELSQIRLKLAVIEESLKTVKDRVQRTEVRSPVYGTIKTILINTVGGVIQPGMRLVEIVPLEDSLLIQAKVKPADVGFLRPGQKAKVRLTAYDFGSYGTLEGELENISADAIVDEYGESYFQIIVKTSNSFFSKKNKKLPIIPGMVAEVDVLTGKRTILEYFLDPVKNIREHSFKEP
ncbi:MAG: hemolysin secretion protein D [Rhodospirillaceae bacterium]|nr:hemolysin secretion protein D [Rhodospirillaceae bacterium]